MHNINKEGLVLEYQKKKLTEKHANYILKLEPFLLNIAGCNQQETRIKLGGHLLHCTPATFSLINCKLLLFLGEHEVEYFKKFEKTLTSLSFAFSDLYFEKSTSFYLKGKIEQFVKMREGIYEVDFALNTLSDAYKEIFLHLSEITTLHKKLYNSELSEIQLSGLKGVPIFSAKVIKDGKIICDGKLSKVRLDNLKLVIMTKHSQLQIGEEYRFHFNFNFNTIKLVGTIESHDGSVYSSKIKFNTEFVHILSKFMHSSTANSNNSEKLEEI